MRYKMPLAAACLAVATFALPAVSSAAAPSAVPQSSTGIVAQSPSLTETVQWRGGWGRCRAWRRECADRWGWGGPRFRRCLWRHGC